jgi:hypothetical protein
MAEFVEKPKRLASDKNRPHKMYDVGNILIEPSVLMF